MTNPLLHDEPLPRFSAVRPEHVCPAVEEAIRAHADAMAAILAGSGFEAVYAAKERADVRLGRMWRIVSHLAAVARTPELAAAHGEAEAKLIAYETSVGQDEALYHAFRAIDRTGLDAVQVRALDQALRGMELSGVALAPAPRARFAEICIELGELSTGYGNALMDATQSWTLPIADEARLAGIPAEDRAMLARNAAARGLEGWLVDLHGPSVRAVMRYADDRALRHEVHTAFQTRASDAGPDGGKFDNGPRIDAILRLRQEAAELLGFANPVESSLAVKMADSAGQVEAFLLDLARRARPRAEAELASLRVFAATLGIATLEPWDTGYVAEKLRLANHALDETEIKRHLPLPRVLAGLFGLVADLYGVEFAEEAQVDAWHPDVRYYSLRRSGVPFAGIYCDFFARAGKQGGAWMDVCRSRLSPTAAGSGGQLPIAFLNCNFARGADGADAYVSHGDMITLFHEMGHCLHHVLTEVELPSIGGIAGVEWDAVELPSQFMENFAWEPAILRIVSAHAETGLPLDEATIARMIGARRFLGALALTDQVELGLVDLRLHLTAAHPDPAAVLAQVERQVSLMPRPASARPIHSFAHIFAGAYGAGYYSYLWAERLSADAFEPFAEPGADMAALGGRFREQVLARGASRPAIESFTAFRGREPGNDALLRAWGLAA
ncbi:M3 family metallopeptidase [Sphingomonas sp.]|uniref:M3 family metallopeptidase n=1 Tax=Sphingomonas sp. TaxID=28214 RepID=UPI001B1BE3EB|nr:M3 family metallopeptidase [Sphingomonas sp.]MBO9713307.1 M3 family metallopeptidase [Sphingomonas sp.]